MDRPCQRFKALVILYYAKDILTSTAVLWTTGRMSVGMVYTPLVRVGRGGAQCSSSWNSSSNEHAYSLGMFILHFKKGNLTLAFKYSCTRCMRLSTINHFPNEERKASMDCLLRQSDKKV